MQNQQPNMEDLLRFAQSPAGQQLLRMLQQNGGPGLQQAIAQAAAGNYEAAKNTVAPLLQDPEMKKLLDQLGR